MYKKLLLDQWQVDRLSVELQVGDYDGVVEDLVALGFLPEGGDRAGLAEPLGVLLEEITAGGGAANVNIDLVMAEMDKLSGRYPFQVSQALAPTVCPHQLSGAHLMSTRGGRVQPQAE